MDNLSVSDEYYDKKYEDIQVRLDKLYDEIEEIETFIEAVETRLYNIKQEKISGDNVYQFLLFFDNLYDRFTDMEKKIFMKSFLEEGNIYEAEQEDGRILRSLKFRFPVFFNEQELYELDWDNESTSGAKRAYPKKKITCRMCRMKASLKHGLHNFKNPTMSSSMTLKNAKKQAKPSMNG